MKKQNILFIMFDQLRFDYLSCYGHPTLHTPHIDSIAARGVRFTNCYVQSPVCGASRMSTYTGRYVSSHGACWNNVPLKVGEVTLGDHLRSAGTDCWLVGKTHMEVDAQGMERLGLARESVIGARVSEAGFDVWVREDGLYPRGPGGHYSERSSPYNEYLAKRGYHGDNPWADYANAGIDEDGNMASGWFLRHANRAANVEESDSETPWLTSEAIQFLEQKKHSETPWLCHVSYIKPHWPYIVPAPYHNMYCAQQALPVVRHECERVSPHPVYQAFMENTIARTFSRDDVLAKVKPAYMGLIKQCDDQMGRLLAYLESSGQAEDTIIVITSDHGDYLGDHWLGEKDLFHAPSVKVPLIIYDPSSAADSTRGMVSDTLVEAIDLTATFVEHSAGTYPKHIMEGESLWSILHGTAAATNRGYVISEYDYSQQSMSSRLGLAPADARLFMIADHRWKLVHAEGGFPPMLFDMQSDPQEFHDLGRDEAHQGVVEHLYQQLATWSRRMSQRSTITDEQIAGYKKLNKRDLGLMIGVYDEQEVSPQAADFFQGKVPQRDYRPS